MTLAHYRITAAIGAGGMGEVYRATDTKLDREVAIKVLPPELAKDPDRLARFEREAKLLASLNHPNIAHVYGFEGALLADGSTAHFLAMELVEGEDLAERLKRGPIPVEEVLQIAKQIAEALEEAHEKGIVHRDLKPANVKVAHDGKVKVLDFGLAKAWAAGAMSGSGPDLSRSPTLAHTGTQAGVILGTAAYMSPEQARGKPVDKRADIWAFGVLLYEMLSGKRLFAGETVSDTLAAVLRQVVDWQALSPASPELKRLLQRCLERDPHDRLRDVGDARIVLAEVLDGRGDQPAIPAARAQAPWPRAWLIGVGASLLALALGWLAGRSGAGATAARASSSISYRRLTFQPGNFVNARFAPDGQTAFLSANWRGPVREIFQVRPGAGELAIGVVGAELLAVSREGELALLLPRIENGNPWAVRGTLAVVSSSGGTPRELAEDVVAADWLPDGRGLAAMRVVEGPLPLQLEFPLGHPVYRSPSGGATKLRVSPAGDALAFFERRGMTEFAVAVVDRNGRHEIRSPGWTDWWDLAWSPDGSEVWFSASSAGLAANVYAVDGKGAVRTLLAAPGTLDLHDVAADGSALVARVAYSSSVLLETAAPEAERDLTWLESSAAIDLSADGRHVLLLIESEREPGRVTSFLRSTDGSPPIRLGYGRPQELSHDGRWALATRGETLVAMPTGPGAERTVETSFPEILAARWLPDDERVVLLGRSRKGSTVVRVTGFAGGAATDFTPAVEPRYFSDYRAASMSPVSPDGRQVALAVEAGIALLPLDGSAPRSLPGCEPNDQPVQWSADGRRLVLFNPGGLPAHLFEFDLASGRRRGIGEVGPADLGGVAGIITTYVTPDLSRRVLTYQRFRSDLYRVEGLR